MATPEEIQREAEERQSKLERQFLQADGPYKSEIGPTNIPITALAERYMPTVRPKVAVDVLK